MRIIIRPFGDASMLRKKRLIKFLYVSGANDSSIAEPVENYQKKDDFESEIFFFLKVGPVYMSIGSKQFEE
jgi:hypothetical protein